MCEMLLESFPQWIINMFIIQGLAIYNEPLNLTSTCISACSVIYGLAEALAFKANHDLPDYPFSKTLWGMSTIVVDAMLRGVFLAYAMTIIKILVILIPIVYGILMLITILIIKSPVYTHETPLSLDDDVLFSILFSFVSSANEDGRVKYTLRPVSKCIFAAIIVVTALSIGQIFLQN